MSIFELQKLKKLVNFRFLTLTGATWCICQGEICVQGYESVKCRNVRNIFVPRCWCTDTKLWLSRRLLLGDLTCLTHGYSVKSSRSRICQTCNQRHCYKDYRLPSSFFSLVRGHTVDRHWVISASLQTPLHCSRLRWRPRIPPGWGPEGIDVSVLSANTGIHLG